MTILADVNDQKRLQGGVIASGKVYGKPFMACESDTRRWLSRGKIECICWHGTGNVRGEKVNKSEHTKPV